MFFSGFISYLFLCLGMYIVCGIKNLKFIIISSLIFGIYISIYYLLGFDKSGQFFLMYLPSNKLLFLILTHSLLVILVSAYFFKFSLKNIIK
jgi:hypothetical protein